MNTLEDVRSYFCFFLVAGEMSVDLQFDSLCQDVI